MKILIVYDKETSAIARLSEYIELYNPQHDIVCLPLHPKRPSVEQLSDVAAHLKTCDVLHVQYWRSGEVIREHFPKDFARVKKVLTHHNPYDIEKLNWSEIYDKVIVKNDYQQSKLGYAKKIPHAVDLNEFKFDKFNQESKLVNMIVGRIEGKKGVMQVAQACHELGYKLQLIGRISKGDYFREMMSKYGASIEFHEGVSNKKLHELHQQARVHVCNSVDGFESGTLPILESMAVGIPVVTRIVGMVPDIFNGSNLHINEGAYDDIESLKLSLVEVVENEIYSTKLTENAWDTVKNLTAERMARKYSMVYWSVIEPEKPLISVITPFSRNLERLADIIINFRALDFPKKELIIVNAKNEQFFDTFKLLCEHQVRNGLTIKYINNVDNRYNLADSRNKAVLEAEGDLLVFCDDRLDIDSQALKVFEEKYANRYWLWGTKDGYKKGFVENFSCVSKKDIVSGGMFNTVITQYGGMTEEIRRRFTSQGIIFQHIVDAKATSAMRTKSKNSRRDDIVESKLQLFKLYEN